VTKEQKPRETDLVEVYTAAWEPEAHIVKARLESEGIPALLKYEAIGFITGLTVDGLAQVHVLVSEKCADDARAILISEVTLPDPSVSEGPEDQDDGLESRTAL
jgi:hypothetical protein